MNENNARDLRPRRANRTKETTFDRVYNFYYSQKTSTKLSEKEDEIRQRWDCAWKWYCNMNSRQKVVSALVKKYGIEERTAYYDVENALKLFGDPAVANKNALRAVVTEWLTKSTKAAYKNKDYDTVGNLVSRIIKVNQLDLEEEQKIDFKNLRPHMIVFSADPEVLKKEADSLLKGAEEETEDISFEDIGGESLD